jgi:epsilon-lactone hydrolase
MSEQQKARLDASLRQAPMDLMGEVADLRSGFEELMRSIPVPDDIQMAETEVGGVHAIEVTMDGTEPTNVILYFHRGVYVIGSAKSSLPLVADLARRTGARIISVDYRLAPEDPYPAAVEDAKAVYDGLLAQGVEASCVAFCGESAGGGLAVAALLASRDVDMPMPSSVFVMSPWADLTLSGHTVTEKRAVDPTLTGDGLRYRVSDYVSDASPSNPYISPIFADLRGLPSMLVQVGSHEILLSDAVRLAGRAARDDVEVTLEVVSGVPHVFQAYAAVLDEGCSALNRASRFLNAHFVSSRSGY